MYIIYYNNHQASTLYFINPGHIATKNQHFEKAPLCLFHLGHEGMLMIFSLLFHFTNHDLKDLLVFPRIHIAVAIAFDIFVQLKHL